MPALWVVEMTRYALWVANHDPCQEAYAPKTYVEEAAESALTVKGHMPELTTVLVSTEAHPGFDRFIRAESRGGHGWWGWYPESAAWFNAAIRSMEDGDRVLYLDTDTCMIAPVPELFELLDSYDLTGSRGIRRFTGDVMGKVPTSFSELAIGVNTFTVNNHIRSLFADWRDRITIHNYAYTGSDMAAMREALWHWHGRFYLFPEEYNCRFGFGGWAAMPVKVLHGRSRDYAAIAAGVNRGTGMRTWTPDEARRWVEGA